MSSCAFTGHRPAHFIFKYDEKHPDCLRLKAQIKTEIVSLIAQGVTTFLSGMALGVDTWAAETVLELKEEHPNLQLVAVLPCETQADRWSHEQRERYFIILPKCDDVIYISRHYTPNCLLERNRYLVDHSDHLLAVYDGGDKGGTAYTVKYARQKGRKVIIISAGVSGNIIDFEEAR